jgi:hypothetical protein
MNKQANKQTKKTEANNQKKKKRKEKKNTRFRNNRLSVLVYILELLLWHPVLVFVY